MIVAVLSSQSTAVPQEKEQEAQNVEVIKVEKHFSRWKYPKEVTIRDGQSLHIVVKGDTLWDLGEKYLGNPYTWPQIWELNKWIRDPHWIYPGNPLIIPLGRTMIGGGPDSDVAGLLPDSLLRITPASSNIGYVYSFQDFLQLPYLVKKGAKAHFKELGALRITGYQKEDRSQLSRGDVVYLGGGKNKGVQVGDRMMVRKVVKQKLMPPSDTRNPRQLGDVIQHAATLRVLSVHPKNAEAVIEYALDGIEVGEYVATFQDPTLITYRDAPLRKDILEPIALKTTTRIVYGRNDASYLSTGSLVIIDGGTKAGYKVGDVLLCVRNKALVSKSMGGNRNSPMTNRYLGQLLVVRADADSSTCIIIATKSEMMPGDFVSN
jgi:hypothetical protein